MDNLFFNNSFGWGGITNFLLMALFDPKLFSTHPLPDIGMPLEDFDKLSVEEKSKVFEESLDEYWSKFMNKMKNGDFENNKNLKKKLSKIDKRINKLQTRRQKIFDNWIME